MPGRPVAWAAIDTHSQMLQISRMIICVCRSLNCRDVRAAIHAGARSPAQVHAHHGTTINCGKCSESVCEMLREETDHPSGGQATRLLAAE
jgi:bacterioferritin-associated ferredoxin